MKRLIGRLDNQGPVDLGTFRDGTTPDGVTCVPRRPTKFALRYERSLLLPALNESAQVLPPSASSSIAASSAAPGDKSSLLRDDDFVCAPTRLGFSVVQTLPDSTLLALGRNSLLTADAAGLQLVALVAPNGGQHRTTISPITVKSPTAAYHRYANEYLVLVRPGEVAVVRHSESIAAATPTSTVGKATYAWQITDVITDPNPSDPAPPTSLHVTSDYLLWWSASKHRGYIFERDEAGAYIYVQALALAAPLLASGQSEVLTMDNAGITIRVRQSARAPDGLQFFTRLELQSAADSPDAMWFYQFQWPIGDATTTLISGASSNDGLAFTYADKQSRAYDVLVLDAKRQQIAQLLHFRTRAKAIAITKDMLLVDCADAGGPRTCMFVRNLHDRFAPYDYIAGLQPLAYRDGLFIGRDHAGPGGAARLVVLRH
ncbi:MAG: hypothetical protein IPL79_00105 [Myxococcales bacterium]|nr:hypothetical protein [Myxococcales bacterium]